MKFSEIISPSQIILNLTAKDRFGAIEEIVKHLVEARPDLKPEYATILNAVRQREENMSTAIGYGVAIPHAIVSSIQTSTSILARSSSGIPFDSLDAQPVKLMVLLLSPSGKAHDHLKALAHIARLMNNREVRDKAESATSAKEIYDLILTKEV